MKNFNEWLAVKITSVVSTMYCAYFFAFLAILGFPYGASTLIPYIQWLSQTFIQLTMLSVIMVGQELLQKNHTKHHKDMEDVHRKLDKALKKKFYGLQD